MYVKLSVSKSNIATGVFCVENGKLIANSLRNSIIDLGEKLSVLSKPCKVESVSLSSTLGRGLKDKNISITESAISITTLFEKYIEFQNLNRTLESYLSLEEDWNGNGADKISEVAVRNLQNDLASFDVLPDVYPLTDTGLELDWYFDNKNFLQLEFYDSHYLLYYRMNNESSVTKNYEYSIDKVNELIKLLRG